MGQAGTVLSLAAPWRQRWDLAAWLGYKSRVSAAALVSLTPLRVRGPRITASPRGACPNTSSGCRDVLGAGVGCEPWKWDFIQASPRGEERSPASRALLEQSMFLRRRGINLGTSFLPSTLFPGCFFLLKQDVAGKTHAPFPVFPSNYSAKEHLAAADERATPACRGGGADFPAAAGGSWQMPLPPRCLSSHSTG